MLDPHFLPLEPPTDPAANEPNRRDDQRIYLQHPTMQIRIAYWRGRVADLLMVRLGYREISREEYLANQ